MQVANQERTNQGLALAYDSDAFFYQAKLLDELILQASYISD